MQSNQLAALLATLVANATAWEVAAALMGIAGIGYALWGAIDNVADLRYVKRDGVVGGPRWITAACLLTANLFFLLSWIGYSHVALTAVYLPSRSDVGTTTLSEIAAMRLGYGLFALLAQATLRWMRAWLRGLPRKAWEPLFGEAARWEARALRAEIRMREIAADNHQQHIEKHEEGTLRTRAELRVNLLTRLLEKHGIAVPPVLSGQTDGPAS